MTALAELDITTTGTADRVTELYAALAAVQAELPEVSKNRIAEVKNPEGRVLYRYAYADLADVSAAILPVLGKHGLAFILLLGHEPDGRFGARYYLLHKSGARFEGFWFIRERDNIQHVGGQITYIRRYILCALTGVAADEDTDANEDAHARKPRTGGTPAETAADAAGNPPSASRTAPRSPRSGQRSAGDAQNPALVPPDAGADGTGAAPDDTDWDTPGTATSGDGGQLTAIWTILGEVYGFTSREKDKARKVCAHIVRHDLETSSNLSYNEAKTVLDTLGNWQAVANSNGEKPRKFLETVMKDAAGEARDA